MKLLKVRGLVLKEYETGEADKRLLLLCKEHGRLTAYARGARRPRSKFMAAAQIFTYSDFVLAQGKNFFSVTQADVIENFYELRTDYDTLCAAHLIAEILDKTLWENSDCDELLRLALKSLSNLARGKFLPKQIICVFLLKFFDLYGLRPNTENCAVCGDSFTDTKKQKNSTARNLRAVEKKFFWGKEGLLCETHGISEMQISKATAAAASFILNSSLSRAFQFEARENVLDELKKAADLLWRSHFDWELRSSS